MPNATDIPCDDASKRALLQHLNAHLPNYAATMEVSARADRRSCHAATFINRQFSRRPSG